MDEEQSVGKKVLGRLSPGQLPMKKFQDAIEEDHSNIIIRLERLEMLCSGIKALDGKKDIAEELSRDIRKAFILMQHIACHHSVHGWNDEMKERGKEMDKKTIEFMSEWNEYLKVINDIRYDVNDGKRGYPPGSLEK
jgi:hypothetical protein